MITLLITPGKRFLTHSKGLSIKEKGKKKKKKTCHLQIHAHPHEERTNILNIPKIIKQNDPGIYLALKHYQLLQDRTVF